MEVIKRHRLLLVLIIAATFAAFLCGCGAKEKSESEIRNSLPEDFLSVIVGGEKEKMTIDRFTVNKRQTNEKTDLVYCDLTMSNEHFELTALCQLQYNYYDKGGWTLDECRVYNGQFTLKPKGEFAQKAAEDALRRKGFDNFELTNCSEDEYAEATTKEYKYYGGLTYHVFVDCSQAELLQSVEGDISVSQKLSSSAETTVGENGTRVARIDADWFNGIGDLYNAHFDWSIDGHWSGGNDEKWFDIYISNVTEKSAHIDLMATYVGQYYAENGDIVITDSFDIEIPTTYEILSYENLLDLELSFGRELWRNSWTLWDRVSVRFSAFNAELDDGQTFSLYRR